MHAGKLIGRFVFFCALLSGWPTLNAQDTAIHRWFIGAGLDAGIFRQNLTALRKEPSMLGIPHNLRSAIGFNLFGGFSNKYMFCFSLQAMGGDFNAGSFNGQDNVISTVSEDKYTLSVYRTLQRKQQYRYGITAGTGLVYTGIHSYRI